MRRETAGGVCARVHACARTAASHGAAARGLPRLLRCRYGGSYGGYATLAGLTFTPELYSCGVDIVGPSNLQACRAAPQAAPRRASHAACCIVRFTLHVAGGSVLQTLTSSIPPARGQPGACGDAL